MARSSTDAVQRRFTSLRAGARGPNPEGGVDVRQLRPSHNRELGVVSRSPGQNPPRIGLAIPSAQKHVEF